MKAIACVFVKRKHGIAIGGPYVAVHLRRRDFLYSHKEEIPSLKGAAEQIERALFKYNLTAVFVATDAPDAGQYLISLSAVLHVFSLLCPCIYCFSAFPSEVTSSVDCFMLAGISLGN